MVVMISLPLMKLCEQETKEQSVIKYQKMEELHGIIGMEPHGQQPHLELQIVILLPL